MQVSTHIFRDVQQKSVKDIKSIKNADVKKTFLDTLNPVARIGGALLFSIPLYVSLNIVTATVGLICALIGLLAIRVPIKKIVLASIPVLIIVPWTFLAVFLYGKSGGTLYFQWGFFRATQRSLYLAASTSIRMMAVAIPSIVLAWGIDPTRFADSCAQILRLPTGIVYGGLAGLRILTLLPTDWTTISYARRARGIEHKWKILDFPAQVFSLLVQSLRRAESMSIALIARGFSPHVKRTYARKEVLHVRDWLFITIAAGLAISAILAAYFTGFFQWG